MKDIILRDNYTKELEIQCDHIHLSNKLISFDEIKNMSNIELYNLINLLCQINYDKGYMDGIMNGQEYKYS
jgi:hypothetical protein